MIRLLAGFVYLYVLALWILSGLMHLWTVYIAYTISGWFWGIVTLFFPVISQIVWGYRAWVTAGFDSPYLQWLIVLVCLWVVNYIIAIISALFDEKSRSHNT